MAKGTIWGSFTGAPTGDVRPAIEWTSTPNVSGNYSDVTASLVFLKYNSAWGSWNGYGHSVSISIAGSSGSASRTFDLRNSSKVTVWSRKVKVNHNSDGRKSIVISASGKTGISLGNYSFSKSVSLDKIGRNSTLNSASFNSRLETGKANSIKYNISRAQSGYVHQFQLRDGATTLDTWHDVTGSGDGSLNVSSGLVNTIMGRMSSVTSKNFTLRMATRDGVGGSWVGSNETLTIKATIGTVSSSGTDVSVSISGSGYDKSLGLYVEGRTRVYANFSPQASGGATIRSSHIVIERTNGQDKQTINGSSGTSRVLRQSGSYRAQGVAVDSRGVTVKTAWTAFTVSAYSPPAIIHTTAERGLGSNPETTATVKATVRHTRLTGNNRKNEVTIRFYRRESGNSTWGSVVYTHSSSGSGSSDTYVINDANKPINKSYDYRIVATDNFGNSNESIITLTTQRVVLDIHKNDGVGIGKVHEQGVLDVDGSAYFSGNLNVKPKPTDDGLVPQSISIYSPSDAAAEIQYRKAGGETNARLGYSFNKSNTFGVTNYVGTLQLWAREGDVQLRTNTSNYVTISDKATGGSHTKVAERGSTTSGGHYLKLYNGTMICWNTFTIKTTNTSDRNVFGEWVFPAPFYSTTGLHTQVSKTNYADAYRYLNGQFGISPLSRFRAKIVWSHLSTDGFASGQTYEANVMAIGRWK